MNLHDKLTTDVDDLCPFVKYDEGSYFGDSDFLNSYTRTLRDSTALCLTNVKTLILKKEDIPTNKKRKDSNILALAKQR